MVTVTVTSYEITEKDIKGSRRITLYNVLSGMGHTGVEVHRIDLWNNLGFSLCAVPSVCHVAATSDKGEKVRVEVSTNWCVAVEHQRSSSIRDYLRRLSD